MPYKERLTPWMLVRLLPNMQRLTVGNFRTRSDAEGHLQILCRLIPQAKYVVMFNPDVFKLPQADTHYRKSGR